MGCKINFKHSIYFCVGLWSTANKFVKMQFIVKRFTFVSVNNGGSFSNYNVIEKWYVKNR